MPPRRAELKKVLFAVRSGSGGDVLDHGAGDGIERLRLGGGRGGLVVMVSAWPLAAFFLFLALRRSTEQEQMEVRGLHVVAPG